MTAAKEKLQEVIKVSMNGSRAKTSEEPGFPTDRQPINTNQGPSFLN